MATTNVDIAQIRANARMISNEVEVLNQASRKLDEAKGTLQGAWTDTTTQRNAEKYLTKVEETQANLNKMVSLIAELPTKLNKFADNYENLAQNAGGTI